MVSISATNSAEHSLQLLHYRSRPKEGRCVAASGNPTMGTEQTFRGRPKTLVKCCRHRTCTMHISIHGGIRPEISEVIVASHRGLLRELKALYGTMGPNTVEMAVEIERFAWVFAENGLWKRARIYQLDVLSSGPRSLADSMSTQFKHSAASAVQLQSFRSHTMYFGPTPHPQNPLVCAPHSQTG